MAFLIEADGKTLLYSGDLRLHGRKPGMARRLIEAVSRRHVDVLLMEGTHMGSGRERGVTEHELEEQVLGQSRKARAWSWPRSRRCTSIGSSPSTRPHAGPAGRLSSIPTAPS